MNKTCTCGNEIYPIPRYKNSKLMVVYDSFLTLKVDKYRRIREALADELMRVGIQLDRIQQTALWRHPQQKECDARIHIDMLLREVESVELVLLTGSDITKWLIGKSVMDVQGLVFPDNEYFKSGTTIVVAPPATSILNTPIGEMRDAVRLFASERRKHGIS